MEYLNYFGFEEIFSSGINFLTFTVFLSLYYATRKATPGYWLRYFHYAMGFMSLTYILPFTLGWLSFFVLEDLAEQYAGIIYLVSYTIPLVLSLICFVAVYKKGFKFA